MAKARFYCPRCRERYLCENLPGLACGNCLSKENKHIRLMPSDEPAFYPPPPDKPAGRMIQGIGV